MIPKNRTHIAWIVGSVALSGGCAPHGPSDGTVISQAPSPKVTPELDPLPYGAPGDDRTLRDVLEIYEGPRSVRIVRYGALRATCNGELIAAGARSNTPPLPVLGVVDLVELDEKNGCARIHLELNAGRAGFRGELDLNPWIDREDLALVVTRPTRLVSTPGVVFADEVHGIWLGAGVEVEVEPFRGVEGWSKVRTPAPKRKWEGFVRTSDLGLAFDELVFEEKQQEVVRPRVDHYVTATYAPDGRSLTEVDGGRPINTTETHVELVDLDFNARVAVIGFVPRALVTEPAPIDDQDVWGGLVINEKTQPQPGPDEMDVTADMVLLSRDGIPLGSPRGPLRLRRGARPQTVIVRTMWGELELVVDKKASRP